MSDRSLKKSLNGKSNRPADADENLDLFSANHGGGNPVTSLDVLLKSRRHSLEKAQVVKPEVDDEKEHRNDPVYTVFEVPLGTLTKLVLEARNVTSKLQPISTTRAGSRESSSKPTQSNSTVRPSNIPTFRSVSAPKKTTTTSASSPKRTVSRSLTPVSRKLPSRSSTPSRISTTTTTTSHSFKKAGDAQIRSRSLTPRSKPQIAANSSRSTSTVRSASVSSRPSVSATPQTPPRSKETATVAFGRPLGTKGNVVNSPKQNTSPDVTRTRPKVNTSSSSLIPSFSGTAATPKSVKSSATVADSTKSRKKLPKASVQMAINHLDVARNGKVGTHPFTSTMLYPQSIRSRKRCGSEGSSSSSNNQEEEEGKSLTKEGNREKKDSARYDTILNVKDVKDTNWLLNFDHETQLSLIFDNDFDSPPDLFPPL